MLRRWQPVSTSIPNVRQKLLTGVTRRSSSSCLVDARCVGLQNFRILDRVRHVCRDWGQLRKRRAARGEGRPESHRGQPQKRCPARPAAIVNDSAGRKLLERPRRVCERRSVRPRTSRAIQREVACDRCKPRDEFELDAEGPVSVRCTDDTAEVRERHSIQHDSYTPSCCTHSLGMRYVTSAASEPSAYVELGARRYPASVLLPGRC